MEKESNFRFYSKILIDSKNKTISIDFTNASEGLGKFGKWEMHLDDLYPLFSVVFDAMKFAGRDGHKFKDVYGNIVNKQFILSYFTPKEFYRKPTYNHYEKKGH